MSERYVLSVPDADTGISIRCSIPETADYLILLTHGAGAGINHWFITGLEEHLAAAGFGVLSFQFPYMEAGRVRTDRPDTAVRTWNSVVNHAHIRWPGLRTVASGKSWGGRMLSHWAAQRADYAAVHRLIFFGFPLHAAGRPDTKRAGHLPQISIPMLFLQGTRDALASPELMRKVTSPLRSAKLIFLERANHGFESGNRNFIPDLVEAVSVWLREA